MSRIERLEKVLNKTSGNPYHDSEGKFTFSPSSFKNTSGKDAEVTDNPRDWYLTDLSRKNINKVPEISSTKELKDYLSSNGIKSDIDNPSIKKHEDYENIEFDALKKQASGIVASVEFCKAVFGKESLSKLKEIKFYSSESETTGSFDVMLKGEKPSKTNGTLELSTDITNRGILHEFIHVVQDSTKRKSQDCVLWSKEILDKTGVNSKAYTGANKNHLPAEQLADLISFGIANGKNLEDVSKVINYIKKNKTENSIKYNISIDSENNKLNKILNSQKENLDYRYDVKAYKEYLKEWLKHKDEKEYLDGGVLSFAEFWEHDIDYEFEDYNKILKLIDEYNKKKELVTNGGPSSGNHNPGQGRGVGKPANKTGKTSKSSSPSLKMSENSKKFYEKLNPKIQESFEKCVSRLKKTGISLDNVELEFVNSNTSGGDNGWVNVVDGDNIDSKMIVNLIKPVLKKFTKKEQDVYKHAFVADSSSEAIIDHELGHVLMYKKAAEIGIEPKSAHLFAEMIVNNEAKKLNIDLNDESTENFSEYAHRNYTEFIAEAYSRPDYSKLTQNVSDSLCNNKYSKDDFKNFIIELTGIQTNENSFKMIDYLRNNLSAKSYFRSERLSAILNKVNRGNPYHDEKGRFSSGHGQGSGIGKSGKENNAAKIYEKYKNRKNPEPKPLNDEERELRVRTIINNAERMGINLEDIKKDDAYKIMKFIGWEENELGTVSTEFGLEKISDKEIKDDDYIAFNGTDSKDGFDSLRDGGYHSKIIDEEDGPGIYTSEYYDIGLNYSKGEDEIAHEERVTAIKINNSNIVSRDDVNKKLRNSNRSFLRNLPDSAVAALAGYDAMWTGNGDKEIVILKPSSAEIIELDEE